MSKATWSTRCWPSRALTTNVQHPTPSIQHPSSARKDVAAVVSAALSGAPAKVAPLSPSRRNCPLRLPSLATAGGDDHVPVVSLLERITIKPGRRSGKPCIRETRITVYDVLGYLAAGTTEAELLSEFPDLTHDDILACFAFAAERNRRTFGSHAA